VTQTCDQSIYVYRRSSPKRIHLKKHITSSRLRFPPPFITSFAILVDRADIGFDDGTSLIVVLWWKSSNTHDQRLTANEARRRRCDRNFRGSRGQQCSGVTTAHDLFNIYILMLLIKFLYS
jgi:hypothetical protein